MEIKVLVIILHSLLMFTKCATLDDHQVQAFHDLAHGHEYWIGAHAMPRKLMFAQKVEGVHDKDFGFINKAPSGEPQKLGEESSKVLTMQEGFDKPSLLFTRDYTPVRKRKPVHNKSFPTTTSTCP